MLALHTLRIGSALADLTQFNFVPRLVHVWPKQKNWVKLLKQQVIEQDVWDYKSVWVKVTTPIPKSNFNTASDVDQSRWHRSRWHLVNGNCKDNTTREWWEVKGFHWLLLWAWTLTSLSYACVLLLITKQSSVTAAKCVFFLNNNNKKNTLYIQIFPGLKQCTRTLCAVNILWLCYSFYEQDQFLNLIVSANIFYHNLSMSFHFCFGNIPELLY